ncbi:hypothetical protein PV325_008229 [Microctonus aethiopoides]|nr:hypothetical protein PV325_008229 [Microctonus aethiopoides]
MNRYNTNTGLLSKIFLVFIEIDNGFCTSSSGIQQPSTSFDSSIISDTVVHDALVKDVSLPETKEAEKEIEAEAQQPLEEGPSKVSVKASTVQTSDPVVSANITNCSSLRARSHDKSKEPGDIAVISEKNIKLYS